VRRVLIATLASLLIAGLVAPAVTAAPAQSGAVPKVVVVVGPSGAATSRYRTEARAAATLARKYTPDVTEIYSPNATWPAVRKALQGASLVIYMGHGNGFPSRYRDSLYPPTQNGFGLNPSPGGSDATHQYFGEGPIAKDVRLAKNAVVLLNHLCYASGNAEPGLAEGTLSMARQRVDNFAAGFVKAGAAAVIAEAYASPNHMVRTVLGGNRSIESAWRRAPSANGHAFAFESSRSSGYVAQMDPERTGSGFSRSIVIKQGLVSADVLRNARGSRSNSSSAPQDPADAAALVPSLAGTGIEIGVPTYQGSTAAGGRINYRIPFKIADRDDLPKKLQASARWDLIEPAVELAPTTAPEAEPDRAVPEVVNPDFGVVTAERLGDVIAPANLKIGKGQMTVHVATPAAPGRYRLTVSLHDEDGVAYDPVTQAQVPSLIFRVTGDLDAGFDAPTWLDIAPGATVDLSVPVANLGRHTWGHLAFDDPRDPEGNVPGAAARMTGTWVALGPLEDPAQVDAANAASVTSAVLPEGFDTGSVATPSLRLFAPSVPGDYLLILDILTPEAGSLTARGVEPPIIRVTVRASAAPAVAPAETPSEAPAASDAPAAETPEASPATEQAPAPRLAPPVVIPAND
jgi:hypothetical protein